MSGHNIDISKIALPLPCPTHMNTQKTLAEKWVALKVKLTVPKSKPQLAVASFMFIKGDNAEQRFVNKRVLDVANECAGKRFFVLEMEDGTFHPIYDVRKAAYGAGNYKRIHKPKQTTEA